MGVSFKKTIALFLAAAGISIHVNAQPLKPVTKISPPLFGFYAKSLDCGGIAIRSSAIVDDRALQVAAQKINRMLANIPEARHNLSQWGAELHIIGKNQQTSDLPEFRGMKGISYVDNGQTTDIDARTRGLGGIYTSCGEENLLNLPGDRYAGGSDICMHEFAHNIMYFGLDDNLRGKIEKQYQSAVKKGLWPGAYAISNVGEYWAELSMWYFGAHGEYLRGTKLPATGAAGLKAYDPEGYAILDAIYTGKLKASKIDVAIMKPVSANANPVVPRFRSTLMFTNNTAKKLKLFWVDNLGKANPYGAITAYNKYVQKTFSGDLWRVEDEAGKVVGYYIATTPNAMVTIN
ncbi:hypothetical protein [Mucilaginibacter antarcticus]|uniref:Basic secretory peptidase family protein n=1 Tax=Mucilaginibacter antarcticus TaxID=1855725 RepID=A0ABW5XPR0_9SPHI